MSENSSSGKDSKKKKKKGPFHPVRTAIFRGMGVALPPLFTIIIICWLAMMTNQYLFEPVTSGIKTIVQHADPKVKTAAYFPEADQGKAEIGHKDGVMYRRADDGKYISSEIYEMVMTNPGEPHPKTADQIYNRYIEIKYLPWYITIPSLTALLFLILYLLGKFIAAGLGRLSWGVFERVVHRLPLVRVVYSSVKQITDFLFSERDIEYTRVVAIEYPRKGIFSLGFVTGESMLDIRSAANEPVLSVLMPTSPMPMTGFTVTIRQSETVDLDITVDQAIQFIVSCGVVVPPQQLISMASDKDAIASPDLQEDIVVPATGESEA